MIIWTGPVEHGAPYTYYVFCVPPHILGEIIGQLVEDFQLLNESAFLVDLPTIIISCGHFSWSDEYERVSY